MDSKPIKPERNTKAVIGGLLMLAATIFAIGYTLHRFNEQNRVGIKMDKLVVEKEFLFTTYLKDDTDVLVKITVNLHSEDIDMVAVVAMQDDVRKMLKLYTFNEIWSGSASISERFEIIKNRSLMSDDVRFDLKMRSSDGRLYILEY